MQSDSGFRVTDNSAYGFTKQVARFRVVIVVGLDAGGTVKLLDADDLAAARASERPFVAACFDLDVAGAPVVAQVAALDRRPGKCECELFYLAGIGVDRH